MKRYDVGDNCVQEVLLVSFLLELCHNVFAGSPGLYSPPLQSPGYISFLVIVPPQTFAYSSMKNRTSRD